MTSCKNCSLWLWVPACAGTTSGEWHRGNRLRGTTRECLHSRGANAPEVCENFPPFPREGRGECRVPTHPQPRMQSKKAYELVTTGKPEYPAFPHATVLTVSFVISPVIGLDCHRRFARLSAKLDASVEASEPHDFAVRVQPRSSAVLTIASIASRPASVTIASAPWWDETARLGRCFASERKQDIFADRAGQVICETARPASLRAERSNPASSDAL